jgi:molybdopterin/thiamine biosynthesis adenylyltransferase
MNDEQLLRYSRHILLPEIGIEGQQRLLDANLLMIGAGGLGSPAALFLASAGVCTLTICFGDVVDLTNLQRQIVHRETAVGRPKVESARETLLAINPRINIQAIQERVEGARLSQLVAAADIVLDGSDNFEARFLVNEFACRQGVPWVYGGAIGAEAFFFATAPARAGQRGEPGVPGPRVPGPRVPGAALERAGGLEPTASLAFVEAERALALLAKWVRVPRWPRAPRPGVLRWTPWPAMDPLLARFALGFFTPQRRVES